MITDVGIDLDGVLFDFSSAVTESFSRMMGRTLLAPQKWEFYEDWGLNKDEFYSLLAKATVEDELFDHGAPIMGSLEGWKKLRNLGVKLHIITHRSMLAMNQTTRWLERNGLVPDSLFFTGDKALVLSSIAEEKAVAVDDHYVQYMNYNVTGVIPFIFNQSWNTEYPVRRIHALAELAQYIDTHNNYSSLEWMYREMESENNWTWV